MQLDHAGFEGLEPGSVELGDQGGADRAGAATQVDEHERWPTSRLRARPGQFRRLADQELAAAARNEYAGLDHDPQPAELGPAKNVLEREAGDPLRHHGYQLVRAAGRLDEQPGLILSEDAAGRPQRGYHRRARLTCS